MAIRDNRRIREEVCVGCNAEIHVFKAYTSIIYRKSCTYVGFLKETHVHIKKYHLRFLLGIFRLWCHLESYS